MHMEEPTCVCLVLSNSEISLVDIDDYYNICDSKWFSKHGYAHNNDRGPLHRLINKTPRGICTDHKNGFKLDNRKSNLRIATKSQNKANAVSHRNSFSKFKGVYWLKRNKKWHAKIQVGGHPIHLGLFTSEEDAAKAYDAAAIKYFGDFARTNYEA